MFDLSKNKERNLLIDLAWILVAFYLLYSLPGSRKPEKVSNPPPIENPWHWDGGNSAPVGVGQNPLDPRNVWERQQKQNQFE